MTTLRPTKPELQTMVGHTLKDVIKPSLNILFCGINPGLYSAWAKHHFADGRNRFWDTLHKASFTKEKLEPNRERELLEMGYGLTDLVAGATANAKELIKNKEELNKGRRRLERIVRKYAPRWVAILGITAYRETFERHDAICGLQPEHIGGSRIWLLPNPSSENRKYSLTDLAEEFRKLRRAANKSRAIAR